MELDPENMIPPEDRSETAPEPLESPGRAFLRRRRRQRGIAVKALILLGVYIAGLFSGVLFFGKTGKAASTVASEKKAAMLAQVNPASGYMLPVSFGDIGPRMVEAGAIALDAFVQLYEDGGKALPDDQLALLKTKSTSKITISGKNAAFLLNFFWALGLVNQNAVLTKGPMMEKGLDQVGNFASTGGWTLGAKSATELFASALLIPLTEEQQARLEEVASAVYRPCCDNPTHFPDCNHGMAMLGLLELMASQDASVNVMFEAAKYVNAFWFPQQMLETAIYFNASQKGNFTDTDARLLVSQQTFSGSGFQKTHQWLANNGLLDQAPTSGGGCAVQ